MTQIFRETSDLKAGNLAQIHCAIDLLVGANIPFELNFSQRTAATVQSFSLTIIINPLLSVTIGTELEESSGAPA